jgi:hypothetical protein
MRQEEAIWRSCRHQDSTISRVKDIFHHKIINIQDHDVVGLIHMNPTSQRTPQLEYI